jgi:phosphotransferase system enzyme I (PtsI)
VAHLYDPWHPAVLHLIHHTITRTLAAGRRVSVCGEMAGDTTFTDLLLAMGLRSFSMHPSRVAAVKQRVLRADTKKLAAQLARVLSAESPEQEAAAAFAGQRPH